jgi:hypothetical protein
MPLKYYAVLCGLDESERAQLFELFQRDDRIEQIVSRSSKIWSEKLAEYYPDHLECRRAFLIHCISLARKSGMGAKEFQHLSVAFALTLSDLVEQRIIDSDLKARRWRW